MTLQLDCNHNHWKSLVCQRYAIKPALPVLITEKQFKKNHYSNQEQNWPYHCLTRVLSLNVSHCLSMPLIAFQCLSLPFNASHCLSMPLIAFQCLSLPFNASHCLSMPLIAFQCLSFPFNASHCLSMPLIALIKKLWSDYSVLVDVKNIFECELVNNITLIAIKAK